MNSIGGGDPIRYLDPTRARLVQALYDFGPLSRAELARLTGASRSALTAIVQDLIDRRLLAEQPLRPSGPGGGKPSRPLWFSDDAPPLVSAHLLPGRLFAALVGAGGAVLARTARAFDTGPGGQGRALDLLLDALAEMRDTAAAEPMGFGVAVGGMVDTDTGTVVKVALAPELDGMPIGSAITERFAPDLVCVDMHPRAQALGDRWFGQGRGRSRFASVYTGEALGVGLVIGGDIDRGPSGTGGEAGHSTVQAGGIPCHCGRRGCWETIAGHGWLRAEAARRGLPGAATMTAGPLARLAAAGQPDARDLLEEWSANLALGLANLHQLIAPGLFILHGDVVAGGEDLRRRIERHLCDRIPPHPAGPPAIALTALDDDATLLGAAGLVLSRRLVRS